MRKLLDAKGPREARALVDRLLVAGIDAKVHPEGGSEVWVIEDDALEPAKAALASPPISDAETTQKAREIRKAREHEEKLRSRRSHEGWSKATYNPLKHAGPLSTMLIVASVFVAIAPLVVPDANPSSALFFDTWEAGEVWRLITPILLHFGALHLVFNMLWLDRLGRQVEAWHGTATMAALVLVSGVAGNLGQYWATGPLFGGMSGVNYALFAFVWMHARYNPRLAYELDGRGASLMLVWFALCATGWMGPIANVAHAVGLATGLVFGLPPYITDLRTRKTTFQAGSWADVNIRGFQRFWRRILEPYLPAWFLLLAIVVAWADYGL